MVAAGPRVELFAMPTRIRLVTGTPERAAKYSTLRIAFSKPDTKPWCAAPSARCLHLVTHDLEPGCDTDIGRRGYGLTPDLATDDVDVEDDDALLLLGGHAREFLRQILRVVEIVLAFSAQGKHIFSIGHRIPIQVGAELVAKRTVTCCRHFRWEAERAGATDSTAKAVRDGNTVSAQTWESHPEFYGLVFERPAEQSDSLRSAGRNSIRIPVPHVDEQRSVAEASRIASTGPPRRQKASPIETKLSCSHCMYFRL